MAVDAEAEDAVAVEAEAADKKLNIFCYETKLFEYKNTERKFAQKGM